MPIPLDTLLTVANRAADLVDAIPRGDAESKIVREYLNASRRHADLLAKAQKNAKIRGRKAIARSQATRAKKWGSIAAAHLPLVERIIGGAEKPTPKEFVESLFSEDVEGDGGE